ncbi:MULTISPECIES: hypothetical protein [unclassified Paenibacillus]|uniref:hypothetical protein n=1 Tax=unclassified Paenibacillus TaxID=185978 RepID=UPI002405F07B|nr:MULTISPECIES: hypothetical protein [unclassified Paenibacillus]MDF9842423.1 hypothetical protein [Paenibacillus sp. PastF-2]MDF9849013.1 hypothetical protein [Paenibacillus sp. PastM-2]MDF9855583.1 hypothetical protein [Paenibacillus sp. PastF-1]MDH6480855.1 hypothetical protein [Paenibacillus sp. PastH-2]MDH6508277.1 hypothetical protein [Paenibacillus sp. PastM-3]
MTDKKKSDASAERDDDGLVTERDIDEDFGLFQEGSYPGSLRDEEQEAAINHAVPKEGET